jgi:hypothetical protein
VTPKEYRRCYNEQDGGGGRVAHADMEKDLAMVKKSGDTYYTQLDDFSFLPKDEELRRTEENLLRVDGDILLEKEGGVVRRIRAQEYGLLSLEYGKGLEKRDARLRINWEYVYGILFWYDALALRTKVMIRYDLLSAEQWEDVIRDLWAEIHQKWGPAKNDSIEWVVIAENLEDGKDSWKLLDAVRASLRDIRINTIFMF